MRVMMFALCVLNAGESRGDSSDSPCQPLGEHQFRCKIDQLSDCDAIHDYPYARNLFCPASFMAARTMALAVAGSLGMKTPPSGAVYFYQTVPDPLSPPDQQAQTTEACLDTLAPWNAGEPTGAGIPLCHLVAYVTSLGPVGRLPSRQDRNPVPAVLHAQPEFFRNLYAPAKTLPMIEFGAASHRYDPLVQALGRAGHDWFLADYPDFSPTAVYDPAQWRQFAGYQGISGGGGAGWGGEIAFMNRDSPRVLLAFGGGGGGGMTSWREAFNGGARSVLGAGGGGGMQFANGYLFQGRSYNGLGLGAGTSNQEPAVQYTYYQNGPKQTSTRVYNRHLIKKYQAHQRHLKAQLKSRLARGQSIILQGGGGMGGGAEYLMANGLEHTPHALSTQAGFEYRYELQRVSRPISPTRQRHLTPVPATPVPVTSTQPNLYQALGGFYQLANQQAYQECGSDYANFACMCPKAQALVICQAGLFFQGDASKIPAWLQQTHCPDLSLPASQVTASAKPGVDSLTRYQRLLLGSIAKVSARIPSRVAAIDPESCPDTLLDYFKGLDTPLDSH
jgi:hypothetical protein